MTTPTAAPITSHAFGEDSTYILTSKNNDKLLVRKWCAAQADTPKGIIVAIHGGMAHAGDWDLPAQFYKQRGYELHALDLPGHGTYQELNEGKRNLLDIESFDVYLQAVHELVKTVQNDEQTIPTYIFGHSMGGLIALLYGLGLGKHQNFIRGFGISAPWLKVKTKPSVPDFIVRLLARWLPTLQIPFDLDLNMLTRDHEILKSHQRDIDAGLRGGAVSPRFAVVSQQAQDTLAEILPSWSEYPLAVTIAGDDYLADAQFTLQQMQSIQSPLVHYHCYQSNLHENFNEINRQEVYEYISDALNM